MQPARHNGSSYSGPSVLSSLTGLGTKEICACIREHYGNSRVKAIFDPQITWFLELCGLKLAHTPYDRAYVKNETGIWEQKKGPTLERWIKENQLSDIVYLVNVSNQYMAILNDKTCCTEFRGDIGDLSSSRYRRCHVSSTWTVSGTPNYEKVNLILGVDDVPKAREPRGPYFSEKLRRYKKLYDLTLTKNSRDSSINVCWPEILIKTVFGGDDPFCQNNTFVSSLEAEAAIEEILKRISVNQS